MARRFDREISILSALDHESIASLIDAGTTTNDFGLVRWIALELVDGESFREAAKELEPRDVARLIARVARAVDHAHGQGIIHRDLKPSNLLIDREGLPRVVDFGVAALMRTSDQQRLTTTGQVLGTIGYMSPEQVAGHAPDAASDQFALGVMLFEALTGGLPHSDGHDGLKGLFSIASWDGRVDPGQRAKLDGPLAAILDRCLDPDPALRFPSAHAFAEDLERWIAGRPVFTLPPSTWRRTRRFVERNRGPVVAAAGILLLLGAALGVTLGALGKARYQSARASRLGDQALLPLLLERADDLWPQSPEMIPRFDDWIEATDGLVERSRAALPGTERESDRPNFEEELAALIDTRRAIRTRRSLAASLEERTVTALRGEWAEAAERVAGDTRFAGWKLRPQLGLIPLGPDPASGLEEFAVSDWGSVPIRAEATGELLLEDDFTPVLVLIPGGPTQFGCELIPPTERLNMSGHPLHFDPVVFGFRDVRLDPYFIGKYEVTQAQWLAITGETPSEWRMNEDAYGIPVSGRHPVEVVSHFECLAAAHRINCDLPTEAQWEYAAHPVEKGLYWWPSDKVWARAPENLQVHGSARAFGAPWP
ncbi:MAG: bifunctional serine/threonine-protein kinase/formylglycine-generating enzyme family protein, partial [Planctomycetota bacterium]